MQILVTKGICISLIDQFHVDTLPVKYFSPTSESRTLPLPSVAPYTLIYRAEW